MYGNDVKQACFNSHQTVIIIHPTVDIIIKQKQKNKKKYIIAT